VSRQTPGLGVTVKDFFATTNWKGLPVKQPEVSPRTTVPATPAVISQPVAVSWSLTSVEEFFYNFNWQGQPQVLPQMLSLVAMEGAQDLQPECLIPDSVPSEALAVPPWQTLTVQAFFEQSNWQGQPQSPRPLQSSSFSEAAWPSVTPSLTLSVAQFWQGLHWEAAPAIAELPKSQSQPAPGTAKAAKEMTLTDLSDLF
jgi:hypothetical protein